MRFSEVPLSLLSRCRGGDLAAFEELCACIQHDLYAFLLSLVRNHEDAADIHQECLVRMFRSLPKLRELDRFPGWLMRMAVNQTHTFREKANRVQVLPIGAESETAFQPVAGAAGPQSPREASAARELQALLQQAMEALPPRQQTAIALYEVEQMSVREISQVMECSEGAVKFHLHEARKKLRALLAEAEPELRRAGGMRA